MRVNPAQSSYLSRISRIIFVEKKLSYMEKFQLSMYDNCGEIENFSTCGEILGKFENFLEILGNFATLYAFSCGEKLSPKVHLRRKNDKYKV